MIVIERGQNSSAMKNRKKLIFKVYGIFFILLGVCVVLCRVFWLQPFRDTARCMESTIKPGDLILVNRLSYITGEPKGT